MTNCTSANQQTAQLTCPPFEFNRTNVTPRGLSRTDAASYVGCSPRMFDSMVKEGKMPAPRMIGSKKVWDRFELDECFENLPQPEAVEENSWGDV